MSLPEYLTRQQVRQFDKTAIDAGIPGIVLMENAAFGLLKILKQQNDLKNVLIVCGKGNNAGDGFALARLLDAEGFKVSVELVVDPQELSGDAATAFKPLRDLNIPSQRIDADFEHRLQQADWVVDAMLGTGAKGEVRGPFDQVISKVNAQAKHVLAVDVPSGLDCDTGKPLSASSPCVHATVTGTFVAKKAGFKNPAAEEYTGPVHVIPIGVSYCKILSLMNKDPN